MTPDRAEQIVTKLCQYRDIGVAMDIPSMYAEMVAEQGWREIGYETWDALCLDRLGGWRLALPREERREAAAAMAGQGMSTRAIGSALGVHHSTVAEDLSGVGNPTPTPTTGLDGKTYQRPNVSDTEPEWNADELVLRARMETDPALTVVVNIRNAHNLITWAQQIDRYARIDRQTKWGNPFILGDDGDRATVIANYRDHYLPLKLSLGIDQLRGKALGCWCAPEPCHGDVLAAKA